MSNESPVRRRSQPLRARPVAKPVAGPGAAFPVDRGGLGRRGGLGARLGGAAVLFSNAGQIAGVAAAVTREVAANTAEVTREVVQQASTRQPASAITTTLLNGFVNGATRAASAVEERTSIGLASAAKAVVEGAGTRSDHAHRDNPVSKAMSLIGKAANGPGYRGDDQEQRSRTPQEAREELRKRGRDLLKRSALLDDPDEHPAFRSILTDMSPDEARVVCFLAQAGPQPTVELLEVDRMKKATREIAHHVCLIGQESGCIRPQLAPTYLDNLARLGVVFVRDFRTGTQEQYDLLYAQPEIEHAEPPDRRFVKHQTVDRSVELSTFGRQLYEMCFTEPDAEVDRTAASSS